MEPRPLCQSCARNLSAVNYKRNGITHYRSRCSSCTRKKRKLTPQKTTWMLAGYKKKPHCEKCGFKAQYKDQLSVYYTDGNLKNNSLFNLRTVCANCQIAVLKEGLGWLQGDLTPDF
jgi:hypothetical protein